MVTPFSDLARREFCSTRLSHVVSLNSFHPAAKDLSLSGSDTPISLSHLQSPAAPHGGYPNNSYGGYQDSSYGVNTNSKFAAHPGKYGSYPTTSAATSSVVGSRTHNPQYSELSGSEDFNPYSDRTSLVHARESSYTGSTAGTSSRPQSAGATQVIPASGSTAPAAQRPPVRRPEKGTVPSDTTSTRAVRQEVDAGRVPDQEEETLPPSYGAWSS